MKRTEYEKIIKSAVKNEIEAFQFYRDVSERVIDPYLKSMFEDFAREEKLHREILQRILDGGKIGQYFTEVRDYKVSETVEKPLLSTVMKPADALALAMKNEEEAMQLYQDLARECIDPEKKRVFNDLAAMERDHKFKMENAFVDIGYPEVW